MEEKREQIKNEQTQTQIEKQRQYQLRSTEDIEVAVKRSTKALNG